MRRKKEPRSPQMVTADVVAVTHLILANLLFLLGDYTRLFQHTRLLRPGRDIIYKYLDYPVFIALESFFQLCATIFSSLPLVSFMGSWFDWFFVDSDDVVFQIMHAEFIIVVSSLFYGICAYFLVRLFLLIFGIDED